MEKQILGLLEENGSLGYERVAALLNARPGEVRQALETLRERGLVSVVPVGVMEGDHIRPASYWRLTDAGREHLMR